MKKKEDNRWIAIGIIVIIVLALIAFATKEKEEVINYEEMTPEEIETIIENKAANLEKIELSEKNENERMQYYVKKFMMAVEEKRYEDAYEMLYEDFRKTYFSSIDSFEKHVTEKFPAHANLKYTNCERSGEIYVLWVTMKDIGAMENTSGTEMNFVVKENDLNDFVLSFSVK